MAEQKAKAKGRKIGRNVKKNKTARYRDRFARCTDNKGARILNIVLFGNQRTKHGVVPKLIDNKNGTFRIVGYPGYTFVKSSKSISRQK